MEGKPVQNINGLLTVNEVAHLLGVAPRTVYRWRDAGRIPNSIKIGTKTVRWRKSEFEKWMLEQGC